MAHVAASNQHQQHRDMNCRSDTESDSGHGHDGFCGGGGGGNSSEKEQGTQDGNALVGKGLGEQPAYIRNGFIRKVYTVLCFMLFITTVVAIPSYYMLAKSLISPDVTSGILTSSLVITLAMVCCCMGAMKSYPANMIFLVVFAFLYGIILGFVSIQYQLVSVALSAGLTLGIFILLTAYACLTKSDFTGMGPYLMVALFGLIAFGFLVSILNVFGMNVEMMQTVYAGLGALLFSFYIVYDTQMIVGGTHKKHQLGVDDWAFGALALYLDIINLFMFILQMFGNRN